MFDNSSKLTVTQRFSANPVQLPAGLTSKQELFARAYSQGASLVEAYRHAYNVGDDTAPATARNNAYKLINHPRVAARIRDLQEAAREHSAITTGQLIAELEEMVAADIGEAVQLIVGSCRYCWGRGGHFQWRTEDEYINAAAKALDDGEKPPSDAGGYGYVYDRAPSPECDGCGGVGITRVRYTNTADLSPAVRRLFRGVETHADGTLKKLLIADQAEARRELHKLKGMHIDRSVAVQAHVHIPSLKEMSADQVLDYLETLRPTRPAQAIEATVIATEPKDAAP